MRRHVYFGPSKRLEKSNKHNLHNCITDNPYTVGVSVISYVFGPCLEKVFGWLDGMY